MKITLFGGTFDPPHLGHSAIATALLEQKLADQVWFLPVGEHAFEKQFLPKKHRLALLELVREKRQKIERYELFNSGKSITYTTMSALAALYGEHTFSFVIGSDNLVRFHEWQQYKDLLAQFTVFVYPREGYPLTPIYPGMQILQGVVPVNISSSQVRAAVAANKPLHQLVKPAVAEYIERNKLYRAEHKGEHATHI
ncbi:nicotinate (nicotinamide) nucleotide adenylyltransferase [Candidatus Woesebacteria bacterium]|nr:nicotinate (nicotinamide) nucleotide adenylyltransferase [Candidatus Woesebacteria bacterium]